METAIVIAIVGAALAWAVRRILRPNKAGSCGSGCAGCSCASKPQGLVKLRR